MFSNFKILHLEPTTVCNAKCPQCAREDSGLYDHNKNKSELSLDDIKRLLPKSKILDLEKMFMCGDFGDPVAAQETYEIFKYFRSVNPNITLGLNTNGSIQNTKWWTKLGKLLNDPYDYCVFSIDGLEDTNHLYRKNTNFKKIIDNATAFIQAGGNAQWDMLVFKHNEHQIEEASQLAKDIGFTHFRSKISNRFVETPIVGLEPPDEYLYTKPVESNNVKCIALNDQSIYMSAQGLFYPCCWLGNNAFNMPKNIKELLSDSPDYYKLIDSWKSNPLKTCVKSCGTVNNTNSFHNQWVNEKVFK